MNDDDIKSTLQAYGELPPDPTQEQAAEAAHLQPGYKFVGPGDWNDFWRGFACTVVGPHPKWPGWITIRRDDNGQEGWVPCTTVPVSN
jgi:hypothetical protein